jgi:hypothetical protein
MIYDKILNFTWFYQWFESVLVFVWKKKDLEIEVVSRVSKLPDF